jgi:hypothetical protein
LLKIVVKGVGWGDILSDQVALAVIFDVFHDVPQTCMALNAFAKGVKAQEGKKVTQSFAIELTAATQGLKATLACQN